MILVGIDPGVTGALARFVDARLDTVADLPTFDGRVDGIELGALLQGADIVYLENTHPMSKNGSIASYKLGLNTGIIIGVVQALAIPLWRVSVYAWRSWNGLGKASKDASRGLARELFPYLADEFRLVKHHNRAEAALIGRYGVYRRIHERNTDADLGADRHPAGGTGQAGRLDHRDAQGAQRAQRGDQEPRDRVVPLQPSAARRPGTPQEGDGR